MAAKQSTKLSSNIKDMTRKRFGNLTVLSLDSERTPNGSAKWKCMCDCGNETSVIGQDLRKGVTTSCGCFGAQRQRLAVTVHGMSKTREFKAWQNAKDRCFNRKSQCYANYGGRGICMSAKWRDSFEAFYEDMGPCPPRMSLDRIDNNGNYETGNCRWATIIQQTRNTRRTVYFTHDGMTKNISEWAEMAGIPYPTFLRRYHLGLNPFESVRKQSADHD